MVQKNKIDITYKKHPCNESKSLLVSVIINCFDSDRYLRHAINSVISQTYSNWEIIFWDNQSTDKSAEIVKSYNDDRIRYFYAPVHTALGEGRNLALQKAKGEYVSFLDCDDWYTPDRIEKTLKGFTGRKIGLVYTNGYTYMEDKDQLKVFYKKNQPTGLVLNAWLESYNVMIPSVMFRRDLIEKFDISFDKNFSMIEEYDFFLKIGLYSSVNYCSDRLCFWRMHKDSLTWKNHDNFEVELRALYSRLSHQNLRQRISSNSLLKLRSRIAYKEFMNAFCLEGQFKRGLIVPYLNVDNRLYLILAITFFGKFFFILIMKYLGKIL